MEGAGCLPEETGCNRGEDHQYLQSSVLHGEVSVRVGVEVDYYVAVLDRNILSRILSVSPHSKHRITKLTLRTGLVICESFGG